MPASARPLDSVQVRWGAWSETSKQCATSLRSTLAQPSARALSKDPSPRSLRWLAPHAQTFQLSRDIGARRAHDLGALPRPTIPFQCTCRRLPPEYTRNYAPPLSPPRIFRRRRAPLLRRLRYPHQYIDIAPHYHPFLRPW